MLSLFSAPTLRTPPEARRLTRPTLHPMITATYATGFSGRTAVWIDGGRLEFRTQGDALAFIRSERKVALRLYSSRPAV